VVTVSTKAYSEHPVVTYFQRK